MIVEVEVSPLIAEVKTLTAEDREEESMNLAEVVETTPFRLEERMKLLVEVAIVKVLEEMIEVVAVEPPRLEESTLALLVRELEVDRLVTARLVAVALVTVRLVKKEVTALSTVEKKLEEEALVAVRLEIVVVAKVVVAAVKVLVALMFPAVTLPVSTPFRIRLEIVVVARLVSPVTVSVEVAVTFPATRLDPVALSKKRLER
jgi:hypothetical protein